MQRQRVLWIVFVAVHLWLFWAVAYGPRHSLSDVTSVYHDWVRTGLDTGRWVGIDTTWVYPVGALVPMVLAAVLGLHHYGVVWVALVTVLNALTCFFLSRAGDRGRASASWWLVFLAVLGPIAIGRIDSITIPLAVLALLVLDRRPGLAAALLTFAAWIKVWPVAVLVAILVASRSKRRILAGSGLVTISVVGIALLLGGSIRNLASFLTMQSDRGLQLESPAAVPWLWLKSGGSTGVEVIWRPDIKTYEVLGSGIGFVSHALTPVMIVVFVVGCLLGLRAARINAEPSAYLAPLALALTAALIVTNKVGSPQYETWLAAPIVLGLMQQQRGGPSFRGVAVLGLLIAGLTQLIYPWGYHDLVTADVFGVLLITVRSALLIVVLAMSFRQLAQAAAGPGLAGARRDPAGDDQEACNSAIASDR